MTEVFASMTEAILVLVSAFPYLTGFVVGFIHRVLAYLWAAAVVGYRRGRYGYLD